ncbi:MAG: hypothetical protein IJ544_09600 [Prevotella sp.]|nr:hypothetical protein [Prevotella sp.]
MKRLGFILMMAVMLGVGMTAEAKKTMVPKMYMFGIAASFNDSIVYFTNVQEVDSAWIESKNNFLLDRHVYSAQLREYLANQLQMPYRTCIVYYNTNRTKLEKKFIKVRSLYMQQKKKQPRQYDLRYVENDAFQFKALDASYYIDEPASEEERR